MAVALTISETLDGAQVADSLQGGGSGVDLGPVNNNSFAPVTSKSGNTGKQDLFIQHDAAVDEITDCKTFIQAYGTGTGYTYGGNAANAAADYASLKSLGNASGSSKNNGDGLSGGLWVDMDWDAVTANQFDQANFPTVVKIYGDNLTDGTDLATAYTINSAAMVYNSAGETAASGGVSGKIGKAGDTVLGDAAHVKLRIYLPNSHTTGGYMQWEWVVSYSFTA